MGAIIMFIFVILVANIGGIYFMIQDKKNEAVHKEQKLWKRRYDMVLIVLFVTVAVVSVCVAAYGVYDLKKKPWFTERRMKYGCNDYVYICFCNSRYRGDLF